MAIPFLYYRFVHCFCPLLGFAIWFTVVVVFIGVNAEPEALPLICCIVSLALCTMLFLSISDYSLEARSSVTARIRLTLSRDILTKLATLLDYQSTSYAITKVQGPRGELGE